MSFRLLGDDAIMRNLCKFLKASYPYFRLIILAIIFMIVLCDTKDEIKTGSCDAIFIMIDKVLSLMKP